MKDENEMSVADRLKAACNGHPYAKIAWPHRLLHDAIAEIERLQAIIDSRPAINAGLPETYIAWSQEIYGIEARAALGVKPSYPPPPPRRTKAWLR